jgi:hypothetical protein
MSSSVDHYAPQIAALVAEYGEVPPLWAYYPRVHPYDICWRMGGGEDFRYLFFTWAGARSWSPAERVEYVRRWDPPYSWLEWVAQFLWPDDFSDDVLEPSEDHFARMEALGFGTEADWSRCHGVAPDKYPLDDDVSSRWIERKAT